MARETLRFQTNVPEVVALAFDDGIKVEGRYGDQIMFTLKGDRVMYVPPVVEDRIREIGIRRGEPFSILKREKKEGNRRGIEWVIEPVEDGNGRHQHAQERRPSEPAKVADGPPAHQDPNGQVQSTTPPQKVNGGQARTPMPFVATGQGHFLLSALVNTIDIVAAAQQYANTKGLSLNFEAADVRALAITAFIQHSRENGGAR